MGGEWLNGFFEILGFGTLQRAPGSRTDKGVVEKQVSGLVGERMGKGIVIRNVEKNRTGYG